MKKAPEAFRTISEVSDILDTPAHVLRFWESKFYQIRPVKRAGGRRYYRPDDLALLAGIRMLLQDQGMTIRGVQKVLQDQGVRHVASLAPDPSVEAAFEDGVYTETHAAVAPDEEPEGDGSLAPPVPAPPSHQEDARLGAPASMPEEADGATEEAANVAAPDEPPAAGHSLAEEAAQLGETDTPAETPFYESSDSDVSASDVPDPDFAPPDVVQPDLPPADLTTPEPAINSRLPVPPAPDLSDHALNLAADAADRPARLLRALRRDALVAEHDKAAMLARRMNALLDRMSDASGAGRW